MLFASSFLYFLASLQSQADIPMGLATSHDTLSPLLARLAVAESIPVSRGEHIALRLLPLGKELHRLGMDDHHIVEVSVINQREFLSVRKKYLQESEKYLLRGVEISEKLGSNDGLLLVKFLLSLSELNFSRGDLFKSASLAERALTLAEHESIESIEVLSQCRVNLAKTLSSLGEYPKARYLFDILIKQSDGVSNTTLASVHMEYAQFLGRWGSLDGAVVQYQEALKILEKSSSESALRIGSILEKIARNLMWSKDYPNSHKVIRKAVKILGPAHRRTNEFSSITNLLGEIFLREGLYEKAEGRFERAIKEVMKTDGKGLLLADFSESFSELRTLQGRDADALNLLRGSLSIKQDWFGAKHVSLSRLKFKIAISLYRLKKRALSQKWFRNSIRGLLAHMEKNLWAMTEWERFQYIKKQGGLEPFLLSLATPKH